MHAACGARAVKAYVYKQFPNQLLNWLNTFHRRMLFRWTCVVWLLPYLFRPVYGLWMSWRHVEILGMLGGHTGSSVATFDSFDA